MEVVREFIDAKRLMSIIPLPEALRNRKLEIIILPADEKKRVQKNEAEISNIVDSLIGCVPDDGMDLSEYRAERLAKYESID